MFHVCAVYAFPCLCVSFQVTHVCWVPASSSIVQTSEDKTIRYRRVYFYSIITKIQWNSILCAVKCDLFKLCKKVYECRFVECVITLCRRFTCAFPIFVC